MGISQSRSYLVLISHPRVLKNEKTFLDTVPCAWRQTLQDAPSTKKYHRGSETFAKTAHIATNNVLHTSFYSSDNTEKLIKFNKEFPEPCFSEI